MKECKDCEYLKIEKEYDYKGNDFLFKRKCKCKKAVKTFIRYYYRTRIGKDIDFDSPDFDKIGTFNFCNKYNEIKKFFIFKMIIVKRNENCPYYEETQRRFYAENTEKEILKWCEYYNKHKWWE